MIRVTAGIRAILSQCLVLFFFLCLTACSAGGGDGRCNSYLVRTMDYVKPRMDCFEDVKKLAANPSKNVSDEMGTMRYQALSEEALSLGAQAALAARAKVIDCELDHNSRYLDQVFNFQLLLLPCSILPPVLVEGRQTLNLADHCTIRVADRVYSIVQQARFVTAPPHWREYLFLDFQEPENTSFFDVAQEQSRKKSVE